MCRSEREFSNSNSNSNSPKNVITSQSLKIVAWNANALPQHMKKVKIFILNSNVNANNGDSLYQKTLPQSTILLDILYNASWACKNYLLLIFLFFRATRFARASEHFRLLRTMQSSFRVPFLTVGQIRCELTQVRAQISNVYVDA